MPLVAIHTGATLSAETKQRIASDLGEAITVVPGKNAGNLMIAFHDGIDMVFAGAKTDKCMFIDIRLHGAASHEAKTALVDGMYALVMKATGLAANDIYMTVDEFPNWGAIGKYL